MANSAILGTGPTRENGSLIRSEQAKADRVVVLIRGAPGLSAGQAYRLCGPNEPIAVWEQWTAGYKNYAIVSTVEAEETRSIQLSTRDRQHTFDVSVKLRGRVVDAVRHLKDIGADSNTSRFGGIFSAVENALKENAKSLTLEGFSEFETRLARVSEDSRSARETQNGILILRCDFEAKPGAALASKIKNDQFIRAWKTEAGRAAIYAEAANSEDAAARELARGFIRSKELEQEDFIRFDRLSFDHQDYTAHKRVDLANRVNQQQLQMYVQFVQDGMDPDQARKATGLDELARGAMLELSHFRQLPEAQPKRLENEPAPSLLSFLAPPIQDDDDDDLTD